MIGNPMDFNSLLDQSGADVKPPPRLPAGSYTWEIKGRAFGKSTQKKTDYVEYSLECIAHELDDEALAELPENWQGKVMKETFYITADALFRLTDFNKIVDPDVESMSVRDQIEVVAGGGKYVKGIIQHTPYVTRAGEPASRVEFAGQWASAS